jgi:hypothetical protein
LDLIARGARFDDKRAAADGFERLDRASATAEIVVDLRRGPQAFLDLQGALWTLERLEPKSRVRAKLVAEAKKPWERALKAAGSKLEWAPFPS